MILDSLHKLYIHELKDLHSAEGQLMEALPKMEAAASDSSLKECFKQHLEETKRHAKHIESLFAKLEFEPGGHRCAAMSGLIEEAQSLMSSEIKPKVLDAALIAAAQRIEHYEMAGYGTARSFAEKLGDQEAADVLQSILNEEGLANQKLTRLAERSINFLATTS